MARRASAKRYAQAIFALASAGGKLDQWAEGIGSINQGLEAQEFRAFLEHAKVPIARKVQAVREAFPEVDPVLQNLLCVLVSRGLVSLVPEVAADYQGLLDQARGREQVQVSSAVPLEESEKERIARFLSKLVNKDVVLDSRVDQSILGGLLIKISDKLIDGTTRTRLQEMGKRLQRDSAAMGV
jgi:F-type H+-transporting ATPase subunit delta